MSQHQQRALLLLEQRRPEMAEQELRRHLTDAPDDFFSHALLALCLGEMERPAEALEEAAEAIRLAPDHPYPHYVRARTLLDAGRIDEAEAAIREAIRIDPDDPDAFALLAAVQLQRRRWSAALDAADRGLTIDAEHVACTNLRATALVQLGRRDEAGATLGQALARDPENPYTHANQGWALLHRGDRKAALEHFRQALRADPANDWARQGLVEALKAGNPVYGVMLRYFLWMSRLEPRTQWMIILGGFLGYRLLRGVATRNPTLAPFIYPILGVYIVFVLLTWTADHLFNLLLHLNEFGRHALSDRQRTGARWVGAGLLLAVVCGVVALLTGAPAALRAVLLAVLLLIPLSSTVRGSRTGISRKMVVFTATLYAAGLGSVALAAIDDSSAAASGLFLFALFGSVVSSWMGTVRGIRG